MRNSPFLVFTAILAMAACGGTPVRAEESAKIRAWTHESFGRIVFDVDRPIAHTATIEDGKLIVEFDRPIRAAFDPVFQRLGAYVTGVASEKDGKRFVFSLKPDVGLRSFLDSENVVIDLLKNTAPRATPAEKIRVRTGKHPTFTRLVFDWPEKIAYRVESKTETATIQFARQAAFDLPEPGKDLPKYVHSLDVRYSGQTTEIVIAHAPEVGLRHFRDGPRVVIDLSQPSAQASPAPAHIAPKPATPIDLLPVQSAKTLATDAQAPVRTERNANTLSLIFDWDSPSGAAVFLRAGYVWVAFDRFRNFALDAALAKEKPLLKSMEYVPTRKGTVIRIGPVAGLYPTLRRGGNAWAVDIRPEATPPLGEISIHALSNEGEGLALLLQAEGAEQVLRATDPEVGDELFIVPITGTNIGVGQDREYVDFSLLAATQGIVIEPRKDLLDVQPTAQGVLVSAPRTLRISNPGAPVESVSDVLLTSVRMFDFEAWRGLPGETFVKAEQRLHLAIAQAEESRLDDVRMNLARFYLAREMMPEALGVLGILLETSPDIIKNMNFRAIRGVAAFDTGDDAQVAEDFHDKGLDGDAEIALWRAALAAKQGDWTKAARGFDGADSFLATYPEGLRLRLGFLAAEAAYQVGNLALAENRLRALQLLNANADENGRVKYFEGRIHLARQDVDGAVVLWNQAIADGGRESRSRATFDLVRLELQEGRIDSHEAIERLEKLRFGWRGDDFEFDLLYRLGVLYIEEKKYDRGLTALKQLITYFDGEDRKRKIVQEMTDVFSKLYLEGEADAMPLVKAIALYNEFRELTPVGETGDRMIEKLADRLVGADLLDRAADLLDYQVEYRLTGPEQARVATRLAVIRLLNHNPEAALKALRETGQNPVSEALAQQRLHLTVRALADIGDMDQALGLLKEDTTHEGDLLRIDLYQRMRNWPEAAKVFARIVGDPAPEKELSDYDRKFVLSWAVALSLSGDMEGLATLHERFDRRMVKSEYADMFRVISPESEYRSQNFLELATKIAEVDSFQSFMTNYRQQLKAKGLSALN